MVSDAQYNELKAKVINLEKKIDMMSLQISRLILKEDISPISPQKNQTLARKDKTKYLFEGKLYCKRRVAYQCVKKYIIDNNVDSYEDVVTIFPDYLQGSLGVIKSVEEADMYSNADKRFYFKDTDILYLDKKPYVICSQWEKKNINNILQVAKKLGYEIEPVNLSINRAL